MSQKRCAEEVLVQQPRFKRQYGLPSPQTTRDPRAEASAEFLKNFVLTCGPGATGVNDLVWWVLLVLRPCPCPQRRCDVQWPSLPPNSD